MSENALSSWLFRALASAGFAARAAIFAKVDGADINPDFAAFIRTVVILACLAAIRAVNRDAPITTGAILVGLRR